jgi:hypothetical protein
LTCTDFVRVGICDKQVSAPKVPLANLIEIRHARAALEHFLDLFVDDCI